MHFYSYIPVLILNPIFTNIPCRMLDSWCMCSLNGACRIILQNCYNFMVISVGVVNVHSVFHITYIHRILTAVIYTYVNRILTTVIPNQTKRLLSEVFLSATKYSIV